MILQTIGDQLNRIKEHLMEQIQISTNVQDNCNTPNSLNPFNYVNYGWYTSKCKLLVVMYQKDSK